MIKAPSVVQGDFDYSPSIKKAQLVNKVYLYSRDKIKIGVFSFAKGALVLNLDSKLITGYENIISENNYYTIEEKRLSLDVAKEEGIEVYSDVGQWLLIRVEALLFKDKYKTD